MVCRWREIDVLGKCACSMRFFVHTEAVLVS